MGTRCVVMLSLLLTVLCGWPISYGGVMISKDSHTHINFRKRDDDSDVGSGSACSEDEYKILDGPANMSASEGSTVTYMCRVCPGSLGWLVYYADNVTQVNNWNDYAIRAKTLPITSEGTQSSELSITVGKVDLTVLCYAGSKTVNETGKLSVQQPTTTEQLTYNTETTHKDTKLDTVKIDANNGTTTGDTEGNQKLSYLFILVVVVVPICITTVGILVTLWKKSTKETPLLAESFLSDRPSQPSLELEVKKPHVTDSETKVTEAVSNSAEFVGGLTNTRMRQKMATNSASRNTELMKEHPGGHNSDKMDTDTKSAQASFGNESDGTSSSCAKPQRCSDSAVAGESGEVMVVTPTDICLQLVRNLSSPSLTSLPPSKIPDEEGVEDDERVEDHCDGIQ